jgi:hypothetical protein
MKKVKTGELTGAALDLAVAKANEDTCAVWNGKVVDQWTNPYTPSDDWGVGGPIIEREKIAIDAEMGDVWRAKMEYTNDDSFDSQWSEENGPTPLIAAMRCFVASKLGDEVDVPDELVEATIKSV